jgi:signal transduction histidine kinase
MRQRIAIAIALACGPKLLIADEPTTALDVTVQAGIIRLLDRLRREAHLSVILITHDLGVMSSIADRVTILYASRVVETGDREELLRLFENLIENALKYGASGGRVIVSLTSSAVTDGAQEIRVMVRDFGPGIAPEHLPRLTERFYRVDVGDSRAQGGTGLGLSLVKHILNRHRGRLLIESVPRNGATFTACFPRPKAPSPAQS